ncbi:hypothetical protein JOD54_006136 [Actinokineospora baliensis]|uniref:hypothetical protein n=1 Tax=Actinokineospora baliensis TaxID=547056 RepID=UPI00195D3B47|nr:hypothetical protein [Actinokineospora baliensis]MBM7775932.1 hypothetical protein [Actinokineospora baliensis]
MSDGPAWTAVGRLADVLAVAGAVTGFAVIVANAAGYNLLADPDEQVLTWTAVGFAVVGLAMVVGAVVRNLRDGAGFAVDQGGATRFLLRAGAVLVVFALVTGGVAVLRPTPPVPCVVAV